MAHVPGTSSVVEIEGAAVRRLHSADAPVCTKCGHNRRVARLWHGKQKMWVCLDHYEVTSTRKKEASLAQRILHKLPDADTFSLGEVLPNRAARRRRR